ncbi:TonB-dependent siderophore receptor [Caldimonas sp. KR1-144]|uniref:TonB-dependent siderophore receptor n=1 Tax=Caldimonas sp. KR1-144 TaxID=3400911 RepID=UPI003BFD9D39
MNRLDLAHRPITRAALIALLCAAPTAALQAQTAAEPAAEAPAATLPTVTVKGDQESATGPVIGYRAKRAASASKTDTPLAETPQSVTVVTRDQIVDQGATNLQDALGYAAGVRSDAYGLDSRTDSTRVRGASPDEYLDGLRKLFNWYTSNARTEPYTLERIEVLRGPAAMLYGQGSTGGVINMVSKRPQADAQNEIGLQVGSWNRKQLQADFTGPLSADGEWLYRLVTVLRDADTQVDHVRDDRVVFAPSLTWRPSADTSLTLQALYQKDKSGSTSQFFPWAGVLTSNPNGQLPTDRFIGEPDWDRYDSERQTLGWLFEHRFGSGWTLRQNTRFSNNEVDYRSHYGDSFTLPGGWAGDPVGQRLFGRFADATLTKVRMASADQNLQGEVRTGAVRHQLLAGLDLVHYRQNRKSGLGCPEYYDPTWCASTNVPVIDAYAPIYGNFVAPEMSDDPKSTMRQSGLYLQDQMKFGEHWVVVAGLRHDRARNSTEGAPDERSSATTKRAGLMYLADNGVSPYLSYSESFSPVASIGSQRFDPLRGKQWEAGVRYEPRGMDLVLHAAVYDLREKNQLVQDMTTSLYSQIGETKTRGVELAAKASFGPADLIAHYNVTDIDEALEAVPEHQAAVWGKWRFALAGLGGFSAGAGVRWMSAFTDGAAPEVPSVALLDAMFAWESAQWRYALNVNNLTDKVYVATCLSRGDCWWGARRNVVLTATYRF